MTKNQLRAHLRKRRNSLTRHERRVAAEAIHRRIIHSGLLQRRKRIGFYLPFEGELDLLPILNRALFLKKHCYLPVVPPRFSRHLGFTRLSSRPAWYLNRFGIHEHWAPRILRARQLDLLFVPLVGFDNEGYRLGMGGGYYDASLAFLRGRKHWVKPYLIGVAYDFQKLGELPREPWDIPLNAVVTDKALYRFGRASPVS